MNSDVLHEVVQSASEFVGDDGAFLDELLETVLEQTVLVFLLVYHNLPLNVLNQTDLMILHLLT